MDLKNLYRQVIMDHYKNPKYRGLVKNDQYLIVHLNNPTCGDEMVVQLYIEDGMIKDVRHEGVGCSICCSSASVASITLVGKTIEEGLEAIHQFYKLIKGEPYDDKKLVMDAKAYETVHDFPARVKCATLAWKAYEQGLLEKKKEITHG